MTSDVDHPHPLPEEDERMGENRSMQFRAGG